MQVWIVMKVYNYEVEVAGVYYSEEAAKKACGSKGYVSGPHVVKV